MKNPIHALLGIIILVVIAGSIALPSSLTLSLPWLFPDRQITIGSPTLSFSLFGRPVYKEFVLKQGLDIQGGMQVVLATDMTDIVLEDRMTALESARSIIQRRVDLFGIAEPVIQTSISGDNYRLLVELPGVTDPDQALQLVGQTASLEFQLVGVENQMNIIEDEPIEEEEVSLLETGLTGQQLKRASVQFDQTTGEPVVAIEFTPEGRDLFAQITTKNVGEMLAIFIDGIFIMAPVINTPILDGQATITGGFDFEDARQLSIQLNAGALPVPITVLEQRTIGASLGQEAVQKSMVAGVVGIILVMIFMIIIYGSRGVLASLALTFFAILTLATYKVIGVTITLPGIAGLLLTIGMAVDANVLIFERMKEELRAGKPFELARELGFNRAWDSIRDANLATIMTSLVLVNPLDFPFLNSSGMVRGFGLTLLIGVLWSLFTSMIVTKTLMRVFLKGNSQQ